MCRTETTEPRFYRFRDLVDLFPYGETKLRALTLSPEFPRPVQPGGSGPYLWRRAEVDAYLDALTPVAPEARVLAEAQRAAPGRGRGRKRAPGQARPAVAEGELPRLVPVGTAAGGDALALVPAERGRRRRRS